MKLVRDDARALLRRPEPRGAIPDFPGVSINDDELADVPPLDAALLKSHDGASFVASTGGAASAFPMPISTASQSPS